MDDAPKIECEWSGRLDAENDISQASRGAIGISVGDQWLTRLEDSWGNTVRNRLHASAHTLACWLAGNWWRLRWEPETPASLGDVDWRMSHSMASAGDGYCWPSILFASDGDTLAVASRATRGRVLGPVRYLNEVNTRITGRAFESAIDAFLTLVLSRLHSEGFEKSELAGLWAEVLKERRNPELARERRLEAICGFDPGEAPEEIIAMLVTDKAGLGGGAMEEVAAQGRGSTAGMLNQILSLASGGAAAPAVAFGGTLPELAAKPEYEAEARPWQRAAMLARLARQEWGFGSGPVTNARLADLLGTREAIFHEVEKGPAPMPLLLRGANRKNADFYLSRAHPTSRRFAASRLLGDHLFHSHGGRLIPATSAKTARQQFQRAFAQEFLCPFGALLEKVQTTQPDDDDIVEAAAHFNVSTRVVEATLVNKGELDREALVWVA